MSFYESWIYREIINSTWFTWTMVAVVFGANMLMPIIMWLLLGGKKVAWNPFKEQTGGGAEARSAGDE
jgi:hypothetical protein